MMFENIIFDFDGTVFDTSPGVFNGIQFMLDFYGLKCDKSKFPLMIGPPLKESFEHIIKMPSEMVNKAIEKFREYYGTKGLFECNVYEGVEELVKDLRVFGKKVMIATSKPEDFAKEILKRNGMLELFDFVGGSDFEERTRIEKIDVLNYVLNQNDIKSEDAKSKTLMIGDRKYDVIGAHQAGLKCCGILWGFGSEKEFLECNADFVLKTPLDVKNFLVE